uniref:Uncharacterized protein n=1 Tax=Romanomermis culicivorax TaxID=13658 RepID=A0A915KN94_ROMCU
MDQPSTSGVSSVQQEPTMGMKLCGLPRCAMEKEENVPEIECSAEYGRKETAKKLNMLARYPRMQPFYIRAGNCRENSLEGILDAKESKLDGVVILEALYKLTSKATISEEQKEIAIQQL